MGRDVRDVLDRTFREASVIALASAVAIVWTFVEFARAFGVLVVSILAKPDRSDDLSSALATGFYGGGYGGALTWEVGGRIVNFGPLVTTGAALTLALLVSFVVLRRSQR